MVSYQVTPQERDLVIDISDGHEQVLYTIHTLRTIATLDRSFDYLAALRWIKKERLVGLNFLSWIKERHENSPLKAAAFIRKSMYKDYKVRKIYVR